MHIFTMSKGKLDEFSMDYKAEEISFGGLQGAGYIVGGVCFLERVGLDSRCLACWPREGSFENVENGKDFGRDIAFG
jgi:hypothetical protein